MPIAAHVSSPCIVCFLPAYLSSRFDLIKDAMLATICGELANVEQDLQPLWSRVMEGTKAGAREAKITVQMFGNPIMLLPVMTYSAYSAFDFAVVAAGPVS